jgi:hypothetical protein
MNKLVLAAASAIVLASAASSASAAVTYSYKNANQLYDTDIGQILLDFDGIASPWVAYNGPSQLFEDPVNDSAAPPFSGPGSVAVCCERQQFRHVRRRPDLLRVGPGG